MKRLATAAELRATEEMVRYLTGERLVRRLAQITGLEPGARVSELALHNFALCLAEVAAHEVGSDWAQRAIRALVAPLERPVGGGRG